MAHSRCLSPVAVSVSEHIICYLLVTTSSLNQVLDSILTTIAITILQLETVGNKFDIFKKGRLFLSTGQEPIIGLSARTKVDKNQTEIFEENMYKESCLFIFETFARYVDVFEYIGPKIE